MLKGDKRVPYNTTRLCDNIEHGILEGEGIWNMPIIQPCNITAEEMPEMVGFNYAMSTKHRERKGLHMFVDDYQFERLWTWPDRYLKVLREFQFVCSLDYTLAADIPLVISLYRHYRKHWLARYWQEHGIKVIPTIRWGFPSTYAFCFDGEPKHSTVAVGSVGTQTTDQGKWMFRAGFEEMIRRLEPENIIFYGEIPEGCNHPNIMRVKSFGEKFKHMRMAQE